MSNAHFVWLALNLARSGYGATSPNPIAAQRGVADRRAFPSPLFSDGGSLPGSRYVPRPKVLKLVSGRHDV